MAHAIRHGARYTCSGLEIITLEFKLAQSLAMSGTLGGEVNCCLCFRSLTDSTSRKREKGYIQIPAAIRSKYWKGYFYLQEMQRLQIL